MTNKKYREKLIKQTLKYRTRVVSFAYSILMVVVGKDKESNLNIFQADNLSYWINTVCIIIEMKSQFYIRNASIKKRVNTLAINGLLLLKCR